MERTNKEPVITRARLNNEQLYILDNALTLFLQELRVKHGVTREKPFYRATLRLRRRFRRSATRIAVAKAKHHSAE